MRRRRAERSCRDHAARETCGRACGCRGTGLGRRHLRDGSDVLEAYPQPQKTSDDLAGPAQETTTNEEI